MERSFRPTRLGFLRHLLFRTAFLLALASSAFAFEDAEISAIVGHAVRSSDYPKAGGVWMARQRAFNIDGVGNTVITEHLLARVFDEDWAKARFAPFQRTYWNEFTSLRVNRARVWKSRTEVVSLPATAIRDEESPVIEGVSAYQFLHTTSVTFPRLKRDDVVELFLTYTVRVAPYERNTRWCEEAFGAEDPVIEQQLVWSTPSAAQVDTGVVGRPLRPRVQLGDGYRTVTYLTGNLPPLGGRLEESIWSRFSSAREPIDPSVTRAIVTMQGDWSWAGSFFGELWEEAWTARSGDLDRVVSDVSSRVPDAAGRAQALTKWIRKEIRTLAIRDVDLPVRPLPASQVLMERAAGGRDKSCLLISALRGAGIQADPVLVRARPDTILTRVASLSQLDRFLVRARLADGTDLWLDPTDTRDALPAGKALLFVGTRDPSEIRRTAGLIDFPGLPARPKD